MHRIVVTTPRDELIADVKVPREQLGPTVAAYAKLPATTLYVDGLRLTHEQRALYTQPVATEAAATSAGPTAAATSPTTAPDPHQVAGWLEMLQRGFEVVCQGYEDVRRGKLQNLQDIHDYSRQATEIHLQMQRELADEAVRQRRLTAQSLADIDVLDRAVKTTQLSASLAEVREAFARPVDVHAQGGAPRGGFSIGDVVRGIMEFGSGT